MAFNIGFSRHIQNSAPLMAALLLSFLMFWASCGTLLTPQRSLQPDSSPLSVLPSARSELSLRAGLVSLTVLGPLGAYDLNSAEPGPAHTLSRLRAAGWEAGVLNVTALTTPVLEACAGYNPKAAGWGRSLTTADVLHFAHMGVNILGHSEQNAQACRTPAGQDDNAQRNEEAVWAKLSGAENNLIVHGPTGTTAGAASQRPAFKVVSLGEAGSFTLAFAALEMDNPRGTSGCQDQKCDQLFRETAAQLREMPADLRVVTLLGQNPAALERATDLIRHFGVDLVVTYPSGEDAQAAPAHWRAVSHAGQKRQGIIASGLGTLNDPTRKLQWFQADFDLQARAFVRPGFSD